MPVETDRSFTVRDDKGRRHTFRPGDQVPDDIAAKVSWLGTTSAASKAGYSSMTKAELLAYANENGLEIPGSLAKADVIAELHEAGLEPPAPDDGAD